MSSLQVDWLQDWLPQVIVSFWTGNIELQHFSLEGTFRSFLSPLHFVGEEAEAYWRAFHGFQPNWDQSPGLLSTEPHFSLHIPASRMARSGHLHPEKPHRHGILMSKPKPPLQLPLLLGSHSLLMEYSISRVRNQSTL